MTDLRLQQTDLAIFAWLQNYGFLNTSQLARSLERHATSLRKRLRQLADAGYIARQQRTVTDEAIWHPTPRTITELVKAGRVANREAATWQPPATSASIAHQEHDVAVNEVLLQFQHQAADYDGVSVTRVAKGSAIGDRVFDNDGKAYAVQPDGLLQLAIDGRATYFFIEVDRGTEPLTRKAPVVQQRRRQTAVFDKLYAYQLYYEQNGFARKYAGRATGERWPFRVLMILQPRGESDGHGRLYNMVVEMIRGLIRRRVAPPHTTYRGYAMFDDVVANPYECLFIRECDVAPIARYLAEQVAGRNLAAALPAERYADVLAEIPPRQRQQPYRAMKDRRRKHDPIRDALLDALVTTNRLRRFSVLEHWPTT